MPQNPVRKHFKLVAALFVSALLLFAALAARTPAGGARAETSAAPAAIVRYSENFDGVPAPQLPAGWTTGATGAGASFVAVTDFRDTAPQSVFAPNTPATGSSELISPPLVVTGTRAVLNFRHKYSLENTWDGGVLEMKTGAGAFQDVTAAGAAFLAGGYTTTLNPSPNPLGGRAAWSGATQDGFLLTSVQLPAGAFGQTVQFRWRLGSNDSFASLGWWIDSVTLENNPTAANAAPIEIAASGTASPYPSTIQIAGQPGPITGLTVSLENFSHAAPDDVDVLLVAPDGRRIVLMSDAGGTTAASGLALTFTDAAGAAPPDDGPLASGIYRPANYEAAPDAFPAPAPQGAVSGTALGAFYGANPNGAWSLYVVDDNGGAAGAIGGGWSLDVQSSPTACLFSLTPAVQAFPAAGGGGSFQIGIPAGCGWAVAGASPFITIDSAPAGAGPGAVNFTVAPNFGAARTGLVTIGDGFNTRTFQVQQGAGCPSSLAQPAVSFAAAGGAGGVAVTAGAGCSWQAVSDSPWVVVTSAPQSGSGTAAFTVQPNPTRAARRAVLTIGARSLAVNQAGRAATRFDFDGDARSDISVYRAGTWYLQQSAAGAAAAQFGLAADRLAPADYDGDGKTDLAVFRDGTWYVLQSANAAVFAVPYGAAGDVPLPADYDGDGRAELAVFRAGTWYLLNLAGGQTSVFTFGLAADRPVPADYDGDGKADAAVYRDGIWYLNRSAEGFAALSFGLAADRPVPADYDGDGRADLAVYRGGEWHLLANLQNYSVVRFGLAADVPVAADYDGDGKADVAVFRDGTWYVLRSSNAQFFAFQFGIANDRPVPGAFLP